MKKLLLETEVDCHDKRCWDCRFIGGITGSGRSCALFNEPLEEDDPKRVSSCHDAEDQASMLPAHLRYPLSARRTPWPGHERHGDDCSACETGPWRCECGGLVHESGDETACDRCGSPTKLGSVTDVVAVAHSYLEIAAGALAVIFLAWVHSITIGA